jgi:hypothetical protein
MQAISRRKFVTSSAILAAGVAAIGYRAVSRPSNQRGMIRLLPVEGVSYSESFSRFMVRARFDSVRDALASIRDRSAPVRVAHINANDLYEPVPMALGSMVCPSRRSGNSRTAANFPSRSASQPGAVS